MKNLYLNTPQIKAELVKCLQCPSKPCMHACPALVSPKDFIAAAQNDDWAKAATVINSENPLGEICGLICPDSFCMKACVRNNIDAPIRIPALQAYIMQRARIQNLLQPQNTPPNGKKIAIIGAGPAGFGAMAQLLKYGFYIDVFEKSNTIGGALNLIPKNRLPREIIAYEWQRIKQNPLLKITFNTEITDYEKLLSSGYDGVIVATGAQNLRRLNIEGEELALSYIEYLQNPAKYQTDGNVAIIGGGAVAVDCAVTANNMGVKHVEMFVRRRFSDMRITTAERQSLLDNGIDITTMTRLTSIAKKDNKLALTTTKTKFNDDGKLEDVPNTKICLKDFDYVILALGSNGENNTGVLPQIIYAGDVITGGTTAVQAIASGKLAASEMIKILS